MRITIQKLPEREQRVVIVENYATGAPMQVFTLQEIANEIQEDGRAMWGDPTRRERLMYEAVVMILRDINEHDTLDGMVAEEASDDEPDVLDNIDDRWDPDESERKNPLIAHNPDPDIPF